jgi:site-specific recombinase
MGDTTASRFAPKRQVDGTPGRVAIPPVLLDSLNAFCEAGTAETRRAAFLRLARWVQKQPDVPVSGLAMLADTLESEPELRLRVQRSFAEMLLKTQSLSLFAEAGLPSVHSFGREIVRRIAEHILPTALAETDARKLLKDLYRRDRDARRFTEMRPDLFSRVVTALFAKEDGIWIRQFHDLENAMRLLASRISGLGLAPEMRERVAIDGDVIDESPFYELVRCTEDLVSSGASPRARDALDVWKQIVASCRAEMQTVHQHMQSAGISVELVFDLVSIESYFGRMERIARVLSAEGGERLDAVHHLLSRVIQGNLEDRRIYSLLRENLKCLARKIVDRTGETGEHYIANSFSEYWYMWMAAIGGGLLTVFTAAVKMRIAEAELPPFIEGLTAGTNYSISFIVLQMLGLALATKQPATTAATFARIIRDNRGQQRSSKLIDFVAQITSTQLAAAMGNVVAVTVGAVLFEWLWLTLFKESYLHQRSASYVVETLHPYASGTAFFALITGVILWLAAVIGSWAENAAVYYRSVEALAEHPLVLRLGRARATKLSNYVRHNMSDWFTSIALGYMLGFTPAIGKFLGIPLDVRHVTLSTGTLALAAARFGTAQWGKLWVYHAIAGIVVIFVLNLGVSFSIAAYVAMRAYDIKLREQWKLVRFLLLVALRSPIRFIVPRFRREPI